MKAPVDCPKCNAPRVGDACPKCGLVASRWATYAGPRTKVNDAMIVPWRRTTEHWDDQSCHDELLSLAAQHDAFVWLAQQYATRPQDEIRDRAVARVRKAAEAKLFATAAQQGVQRGARPYRSVKTVMAMLIAVMLLGLMLASLLAYVMPHPKDDAEPAPSPVTPPPAQVHTPPKHASIAPSSPSGTTTTVFPMPRPAALAETTPTTHAASN